jgi:hypothetical protein
MAKIVFGGGVAEMRGKVGGIIFSRNKSGACVRPSAAPVQPRSTRVMAIRHKFREISNSWFGLLEDVKQAWREQSATVTDSLGQKTSISGYTLYQYVNRNMETAGLAYITSPPDTYSVNCQINYVQFATNDAGTGTPPAKLIKVYFDPTPLMAGIRLFIYATPKMSKGRTTNYKDLRLVKVSDAAQAQPVDFTADYSLKFGSLSALDIDACRIFFGVRFFDAINGMTSALNAVAVTYGNAEYCIKQGSL